jgi:acetyl esterase/lipase
MNGRDGLGRIIKREIVRAVLERTQSMDLKKSMTMVGAKEPVTYSDVKENLNVAYVNRDEVALAMDIFEPEKEMVTELPVILAIHGGGLFMGDRGLERAYCRMLAHKGYLVFSLEYRLAPKANLCEQLDDVCAGLDHVGRMLVDYDVDYNRIFLVADSAGAYLAAYVTAMHGSLKLQNAIGHKPSRMVYTAVGFISGMFYTNKKLQEQIYGDKRHDERFLKFMNIEHPEIINNMPPAFLITSCGDTFNNFSIRFNKALKRNGRVSRLVYLGNEELQHIFPITNPEHPRSLEVTDKMLEWFEEQAVLRCEAITKEREILRKRERHAERIAAGEFSNMKVWRSIRDKLCFDESALDRTAIIDCTTEYTYEQMYGEWERYARVFSALDICCDNSSRVALCGVISAESIFALFGLNMTGAEVSLFSYPDFLPGGMWKTMIENEKITDLIIADIIVTPEIRQEIESIRDKMGLRNVIYMHSLMGGPAVGPAELTWNEINYHMLKRIPGTVFMDELLIRYGHASVKYDETAGDRPAFILHASGRADGKGEPLFFTDKAFNDLLNVLPKGMHSLINGSDDGKPMRILQPFDFSSVMSLSAGLCTALCAGDTVVTTYFGFVHPKFIRAVEYYNVSVLITTGFMMDK